jgi:DNA-binding transcriptional regulator YiaG
MMSIYMEPEKFRSIRKEAALSLKETARVLRIGDLGSVHRWEKGARPISGPVSIIMELIDRDELPERYYDCLEA